VKTKELSGFLNIHKPRGLTSYDVVRHAKKALKTKKIGHAGNLDPEATGVLVLGVGTATRFLSLIMDLPKEYIAEIQLGVLTDTLDAAGQVLDRKPVPPLTREQVEAVLQQFKGEIDQIPPSFSAIKIEGKRLYELAREGILITPKPKRVTIYAIDLLDLDQDRLKIRVYASKGTYVRSLARDLGAKLGTYGIVHSLVRTRVGHFRLEDSTDLDQNLAEHLIPTDRGLSHLPQVYLRDVAVRHFLSGSRVSTGGIVRKSGYIRSFQLVRVYDEEGRFLGVGVLKWEGLYPKRLLPLEK